MPYTATNGIDIWYEITGSGPLVVLIHGHSADLRMWNIEKPEILNPLLVDFLDRASRQTRAPGNAAKGG